jgi:hypothetical protein
MDFFMADTDLFSSALADDQYGLPIFFSRYLEPIPQFT